MAISYFTIPLHEGLGNQLFMVAAAFALASEVPEVTLIIHSHRGVEGRPNCWQSGFFDDCALVSDARHDQLPNVTWQKVDVSATPFSFVNYQGQLHRALRRELSISITGYFQNKNYLPPRDFVMKLFNIEVKQALLNQRHPLGDNTISLHFRLGDYKKCQKLFPPQSDFYYQAGLQALNVSQTTQLVIFNEREDQKEVEERVRKIVAPYHLDKEPIFVSSFGLKAWEEMIVMSLCNHNIIANSTFSWWAAYFNNNLYARVIYPRIWINHLDAPQIDLAYPGWMSI